MTNYKRFLDPTGIVIGGYGNEDFFPSFEVYDCYGFLNGDLVSTRDADRCRKVTVRGETGIVAFATTDMIETFQMGIAPDVFVKIAEATEDCLRKFAESVRDAIAPGTQLPDLSAAIRSSCAAHQDQWMGTPIAGHFRPLSRVIGSLPLLDMAALAKSLIELESLKERVTESTESVAGPIDVAAISKHDGFVWIDRKHYFRADLNPRFFRRQVPSVS